MMYADSIHININMKQQLVDARRARSARGGAISNCPADTWTRTNWSSTGTQKVAALPPPARQSILKSQCPSIFTI